MTVFAPYFLKQKLEDAKLRWKEKKTNLIIWATDLASCPQRYDLGMQYPEIAIAQFSSPQFVIGELIHKAIENFELYDDWEKETEIAYQSEEGLIKGRVDLFHRGQKILIEIKTGRDVKNPPSPHHVLQVWIYKQLMGSEHEYIVYITYGRIIDIAVLDEDYVNVFRMIKFPYFRYHGQQKIIDEYIKWWRAEAPTPLFNWECDYCPYAHLCHLRKTNQKR